MITTKIEELKNNYEKLKRRNNKNLSKQQVDNYLKFYNDYLNDYVKSLDSYFKNILLPNMPVYFDYNFNIYINNLSKFEINIVFKNKKNKIEKQIKIDIADELNKSEDKIYSIFRSSLPYFVNNDAKIFQLVGINKKKNSLEIQCCEYNKLAVNLYSKNIIKFISNNDDNEKLYSKIKNLVTNEFIKHLNINEENYMIPELNTIITKNFQKKKGDD